MCHGNLVIILRKIEALMVYIDHNDKNVFFLFADLLWALF